MVFRQKARHGLVQLSPKKLKSTMYSTCTRTPLVTSVSKTLQQPNTPTKKYNVHVSTQTAVCAAIPHVACVCAAHHTVCIPRLTFVPVSNGHSISRHTTQPGAAVVISTLGGSHYRSRTGSSWKMQFQSGSRFSTLVPARVDFDPARACYPVRNRVEILEVGKGSKKISGSEPVPTPRFRTV